MSYPYTTLFLWYIRGDDETSSVGSRVDLSAVGVLGMMKRAGDAVGNIELRSQHVVREQDGGATKLKIMLGTSFYCPPLRSQRSTSPASPLPPSVRFGLSPLSPLLL